MKYKYIRAWCHFMNPNTSESWVKEQIQRAESELAPETALFHAADGTWRTYEDIENEDVKRRIDAILSRMEI